MLSPLTIDQRLAELQPDTDPASVEAVVEAAPRPLRLLFGEPLPDDLLAAAAAVSRRHPDVGVTFRTRRENPDLSWLSGFEHVESLVLSVWHATDFDVVGRLVNLRTLNVLETKSKRPSLAFLAGLTRLEELRLEGHDKDFDAVGELAALRHLKLRIPRVKSLDALRGHAGIEVFEMELGGTRDLSPLADLPALRGLHLYRVRQFDTDDFDALGECGSLEVVSLAALRHVESLRALARRPAATLRLLLIETMSGLKTLADLTACERLAELGLYETRPADRRLDVLLECPRLNRLIAEGTYPEEQVEALAAGFTGDTLVLHSRGAIRGSRDDVLVSYRARVTKLLEALT